MQVFSVGEVLWDLFAEEELLGGAPLNFSVNAARLGHRAALLTAVGQDERGRRAVEAMTRLGVDARFVQVVPGLPTGVAIVSTTPEGEPTFSIPRPAAFDAVELTPEAFDQLRAMEPDWLYLGTLAQRTAGVERLTEQLAGSLPGVRCFYDLNLRPSGWDLPLVQRLCKLASVLKLNESEAQILWKLTAPGTEAFSLETFCAAWSEAYGVECLCVTLGPAGCFVYSNGTGYTAAGYPVTVADTVGAGDAFAAAFLHGYAQQWPVPQIAGFANAAGALVAGRPGATPPWSAEECLRLASSLP